MAIVGICFSREKRKSADMGWRTWPEYMLLFSSLPIAGSIPSSIAQTLRASSSIKILQGNDDGWAECNIRTLYKVLKQRGHQTVISAPVRNKSGSGSSSKDWNKPLTKPGEYDSVDAGAPGVGHDPLDTQIWYVNAFPADGIRFGLGTLIPQLYDGKPDLIITGPNVGKNTELQDWFSGTLGAAAYGSKQGVPAIAISADDGNRHGYQDIRDDDSSEVYADATVRVLEQLLRVGEDGAYLPEGCVLNINLQKAGPHSNCRAAEDYHFVLSSVFGTNHHSGIHHCNSDVLPGEQSVLEFKNGCWASVTVMQAEHLIDASPAQKQFILDRAPHFFSCPDDTSQAEDSSKERSVLEEGFKFIKQKKGSTVLV